MRLGGVRTLLLLTAVFVSAAPMSTAGAAVPVEQALVVPSVSASMDRSTIPYGGSSTVTGVLRLEATPLADQDLVLRHSPNGTSGWTDVETGRTDGNGEVTATVAPVDKSYYRWEYSGSGEYAPALSSAVSVKPGVSVSTPNLPAMAIVGRTYRAYGYLKPRHPSGVNHVRIQVLRKSGGAWVVHKTYAARNSDYSSYTKYSKSISLPRGFWRLKAYAPADSKHVATYSGTKSVTVGASYLAYRGLGAWVDIFDDRAFDHPEAAVRDMAAHGVRTLYVETSNSSRTYAIHRPARMRRLIRAAHARKMRVVAWYLPDLRSTSRDYSRVKQAIRFRTSDGQRFDSFALDIESSKVRPVSVRNRRLLYLSGKIRRLVGPKYPLGAIIPSPVGIQRARGYWPRFPYSDLAKTYDAFVPMSYYTYHGNGAAAAYDDTIGNVTILRGQRNCVAKPIHLIGGLASGSSVLELRAFVRASQETTCQGASLYDWQSTTGRHWAELKAVKPR